MAFVKTTWVDDGSPDLTAAQLNRIEQGIADAHSGKAAIPVVAALPTADLTDGMTVRLLPSTSLNVTWLMTYTATYPGDVANPGSSKWQCIGGSPWEQEWLNESGTSNAAVNSWEQIAGISAMTVPQSGTYDLSWQIAVQAQAANAMDMISGIRKAGVTLLNSYTQAWARTAATGMRVSPGSSTRVTLAKNDVLTMWWSASASTAINQAALVFARATVMPVRLAQ